MATIPNKATFYRLLSEGRFGNRYHAWSSVPELLQSGYNGLVSLRYASGRGGHGRYESHIPVGRVERAIQRWVADGYDANKIKLGETIPMRKSVISGELARLPQGWVLLYSTWRVNARKALNAKSAKHLYGICALAFLRQTLDAESYSNLMAIFEEFPDAVVEFSYFRTKLGVLEQKIIIWEVRDY